MAVRIEKIIATVLDEAHKRQVEEVSDTLEEGSEGFYESRLDREPRSFGTLVLSSSIHKLASALEVEPSELVKAS